MAYAWPGNVRELRNALQRATTLSLTPGKTATPFDKLVFNLGPASTSPLTLGSELPGVSSDVPFKEAKEQLILSFEQLYVSSLLARHRGHVTKAAAAAGLSRKHLHELMRKIAVEGDDDE
jgi:DNA-binding NtrC family response regulator